MKTIKNTFMLGKKVGNPQEILASREKLNQNKRIQDLMIERNDFIGVLNTDLQFVMINQTKILGQYLGSPNHGQRPGPLLNCSNYLNHPGRCGTNPDCSSCQLLSMLIKATLYRGRHSGRVKLNLRNMTQGAYDTYFTYIETLKIDGEEFFCLFMK
jgi:hypothetical protein